eukprot:symbB.v1.2.010093.t1/scaffold653.1/size176079/3
MGSVLVSGCSTFDSKLLLYITDNSRCTDETFAVLDKWLAWSLTELQLGFYLDIDAFGAPYKPHSDGRKGLIADGYRAVVCFYKGDEKYVQKCYKTSHSAVSKNCCFTCLASTETGPLLYTHHGRSASHRATILTTEQFITQVAGVRTFINIPGWHVSMLVYDWLHIVDLCIIPETSASTLVELTREAVFGDAGTQDERLRLAYVMFSRACKNAKIRCRGQIFSMPAEVDDAAGGAVASQSLPSKSLEVNSADGEQLPEQRARQILGGQAPPPPPDAPPDIVEPPPPPPWARPREPAKMRETWGKAQMASSHFM